MAERAGVVPAVGSQAAALFQQALVAGFGDEDDSRLLSLLQAQPMAGPA